MSDIVIGFIIVVFSIIVPIVIGLAVYIAMALGLRAVAIHQGHAQNSILAFIPIAQWVLIGQIQKEIKLFNQKLGNLALILPISFFASGIVAFIVGFILGLIPFIGIVLASLAGTVIGLIPAILLILVNIEIMKKYEPRYAIVYGIFSPVGYFLIFLGLRKNKYPPLNEIPVYTLD